MRKLCVLLMLGVLALSGCAKIQETDAYEKVNNMTGGELNNAVEKGSEVASAVNEKVQSGINSEAVETVRGVLNVSLDLDDKENVTAKDYVAALQEKIQGGGESADKGAAVSKAYAILSVIDPDTKITPEMVDVLVMFANDEQPETMDVLRVLLPEDTVNKIDPETNPIVGEVTKTLGELKQAVSSVDKDKLMKNISALQSYVDQLKKG